MTQPFEAIESSRSFENKLKVNTNEKLETSKVIVVQIETVIPIHVRRTIKLLFVVNKQPPLTNARTPTFWEASRSVSPLQSLNGLPECYKHFVIQKSFNPLGSFVELRRRVTTFEKNCLHRDREREWMMTFHMRRCIPTKQNSSKLLQVKITNLLSHLSQVKFKIHQNNVAFMVIPKIRAMSEIKLSVFSVNRKTI